VGKIEGRLFRLNLLNSRGERVTPQNSYLDWLVVSVFRQWLAEHTSPPPLPQVPQMPQSRNGHHSRNNTVIVTTTHHTNQTIQQFSPLPTSSISSSPQTVSTNLGRIYRILGTTPSNYLNHDDCKKFLKLSPEIYSRESLKKFEKRLEEVKSMAREIVRPLMRSSLSGEGSNSSYLVCTRVDERDFPWSE